MVVPSEVEPNELIEKVAEKLKGIDELKPPQWAAFVKTGVDKQRPPVRDDWWYVRAASVLRTINKLGPIGVSKLRTKYGGKKGRGHKPEEFRKASGSVLRKILQKLEKAALVKHVEKGVHKGRVITPKGKSLLDKTASEILGKPVQKEEKPTKEKPKARKPKGKPGAEAKPEEKAKEESTQREVLEAESKEKIEEGVEKIIRETKKHFTEKKPSAEEIVEEVKKEEKKPKKKEQVPTAHELAEKKSKK